MRIVKFAKDGNEGIGLEGLSTLRNEVVDEA